MLVICFDFGMKYIGVAIGQQITNTTNSLPAIKARDGKPLTGEIERIISEWQPKLIIVGNPLTLDGNMQTITYCAHKFAKRLYNTYKIPVELVDERYSTKDAKKLLAQDPKRSFATINSKAAELILQKWLTENRHVTK